MAKLNKHLLECQDKDNCGEIFYVLNDSASEKIPDTCPFCGSKEIKDYIQTTPTAKDEDEDN